MTTTREQRPAGSAPSVDEMEQAIFRERDAARRKQATAVWGIRIGVAVLFFGAWHIASTRRLIDPLLISSPLDVAKEFIHQLGEGRFWTDVLATFNGAMSGLLIGATLGILSGVCIARSPVLDRATGPFLTLANSLPRPALAPIFILWFGLGVAPKALVAASVVYFVLLTNTASALKGIDHDIDTLSRSLSMTAVQRFLKVEFPSALPTIIGGLRLGAVYSVLGAVVSEMVGAYTGLGQRLVVATNNFQVAQSFAVLLAMGLLSVALNYAISVIERLVQRT